MKNNHFIIYGLNNCIHFLNARTSLTVKSIYINKNSKIVSNKIPSKLLDAHKHKIKYLDNLIFNNKFQYKHNQGVVIEFNGDLYKSITDIPTFKDNDCIVIADQIEDPQNLGQMIRTAECAGVKGIVLPKHRSVHITNSVLQVSQGAFSNIDVYIENNLVNTINYLKEKGFWIIGLENSIKAKAWHQIDYSGKIAIVVGSEGKGIRKLVKNSCDFLATIAMKGKVNSLNVSAALSAILFERQRQID